MGHGAERKAESKRNFPYHVIPAQAGIQKPHTVIPSEAGIQKLPDGEVSRTSTGIAHDS
jgi:hypothetical protein